MKDMSSGCSERRSFTETSVLAGPSTDVARAWLRLMAVLMSCCLILCSIPLLHRPDLVLLDAASHSAEGIEASALPLPFGFLITFLFNESVVPLVCVALYLLGPRDSLIVSACLACALIAIALCRPAMGTCIPLTHGRRTHVHDGMALVGVAASGGIALLFVAGHGCGNAPTVPDPGSCACEPVQRSSPASARRYDVVIGARASLSGVSGALDRHAARSHAGNIARRCRAARERKGPVANAGIRCRCAAQAVLPLADR